MVLFTDSYDHRYLGAVFVYGNVEQMYEYVTYDLPMVYIDNIALTGAKFAQS